MVDTQSKLAVSAVARRKGPGDVYVLENAENFLRTLGCKVTVQGDAEPALMSLLHKLRERNPELIAHVRSAPVASHQSNGGVEVYQRYHAGL
eukprot:4156907-Alexandrium_andersonii.AAC.1